MNMASGLFTMFCETESKMIVLDFLLLILILTSLWHSLSAPDPVIVPQVQNALIAQWLMHRALTNVNVDRGFESWPGYG